MFPCHLYLVSEGSLDDAETRENLYHVSTPLYGALEGVTRLA